MFMERFSQNAAQSTYIEDKLVGFELGGNQLIIYQLMHIFALKPDMWIYVLKYTAGLLNLF